MPADDFYRALTKEMDSIMNLPPVTREELEQAVEEAQEQYDRLQDELEMADADLLDVIQALEDFDAANGED